MRKIRIPNPLQVIGELRHKKMLERRNRAIRPAIRNHRRYSAQMGYNERILREVLSFTGRLGLEPEGATFSKDSRMGKILHNRIVTFSGPADIARAVIVVPEDSPHYKDLFMSGGLFKTRVFNHRMEMPIHYGEGPNRLLVVNQAIFIPEKLLKSQPATFRGILRHEILHFVFGCNEIVAYAISEIESFERAERGGLKGEITERMDRVRRLEKKARNAADRKYIEEAKIGIGTARMAVELGLAFGANAKKEFIYRLIEENPATTKEIEAIRDEITGSKK